MPFPKGHRDYRRIGVKRTPKQLINISKGHLRYWDKMGRKQYKCIDCGKPVRCASKRCRSCYYKSKIGTKVTLEALKKRLITRRAKYNGHTNSNEGKNSFASKTSGRNHWNWKGGVSRFRDTLKSTTQYRVWRQQVFIRDDFTCQDCGERGGYLEAHHIKPLCKLIREAQKYMPLFDLLNACLLYSPIWDLINGKTLCKKCHNKIPKRR